ncbi:MAG: glyceraldehyde 3-phosphate dehydrogenase NAD-binding domain-containing protein, partial [Pseudomonadota bacterium]|nr:glyceraldehyde 3-phosphate dehydrogenase NAD-binding domain-containing protein [Pseudomonadota bacterium]
MATRVAINGFGRIGRNVLRTAINEPDVEIVHINDLASIDLLAHLLKYDSVHGPFDAAVEAVDGGLTVNGKFIATSAERNPTDLPWAASNIDVVMECTGLFRSREKAALHLEAGAKKVIISAPGVDPDATVCVGVNEGILKA